MVTVMLELDIEKKRLQIEALRGKASEESRGILIEAIKDESWRIRKTALEILLQDYPPDEIADILIKLLYLGDNAGARNAAIEGLTRLGRKATPYLLEAFETPDRDVRKFIIDILGSFDDPRAIPLMLKALSDEDENVKVTAVEHLGRVKESSVVDALIRILEGEDVWTAYPAADALGRIGDRRAIPYLLRALSKKTLRVPVLRSLARFRDPSTIESIVSLLQDSSKTVQEEVLKCLIKFYHAGINPELIVNELKKIYDDQTIFETCLKYAWSNKPDVRVSAIMLLGLLKDERSLKPLLEISQEEEFQEDVRKAIVFMGKAKPESLLSLFEVENPYHRRFLAHVAGEIGSELYTEILIGYIQDEDGHVRAMAAKALSMIGDTRVVPHIKRLLQDPYEDVQEAAVEALSLFKDSLDINEILLWLSADEPGLRRNACRLLGLLKATEAVSQIGFSIKDSDHSVRRAAVEALRKIGTVGGDVTMAAKRYLSIALTDEVRDIRVGAIYSLGSIGGEDVAETMKSLLYDMDDFVKVAAIKVLGRLRSPSTLKDLIDALNDPNGFVKTTAIEALSNFDNPEAIESILKMLDDPDLETKRTAIEALVNYKEVEKRILPFLRSEEWSLRMAAVKALGRSVNPSIRTELEKLLDTEDDISIRNMLLELLDVKGNRVFPDQNWKL